MNVPLCKKSIFIVKKTLLLFVFFEYFVTSYVFSVDPYKESTMQSLSYPVNQVANNHMLPFPKLRWKHNNCIGSY